MPKQKGIKLNLSIEPDLKAAVLVACKLHKMTFSQFITFALKKKCRFDTPGIELQDPFFIYTTKEERANRRINRYK